MSDAPVWPEEVRLVLRDGAEVEPVMLFYAGFDASRDCNCGESHGIHVWRAATLIDPRELFAVKMAMMPAHSALELEFLRDLETP